MTDESLDQLGGAWPVLLVLGCGGCSGGSSSAVSRPASAAGTDACGSLATCYSPAQIRVAYGIQPLTDRGIVGRGQTVVLPELAEQRLSPGANAAAVSNIGQDLAGFDKLFDLPAPRLQVTTTFAPGASRWLASGEEMLDAEMIHAVAPAAAIRVLLFNASAVSRPAGYITALIDTVRFGAAHGEVISITAAEGEHCFTSAEVARLNAALQTAARRHVTVVAASRVASARSASHAPCRPRGPSPRSGRSTCPPRPALPCWPRAVPGWRPDTKPAPTAARRPGASPTEPWEPRTRWPPAAGSATGFARPGYQDGMPSIGTARGVPDVAADATGHTGMTLVISAGHGRSYIGDSGGTSGSTPF